MAGAFGPNTVRAVSHAEVAQKYECEHARIQSQKTTEQTAQADELKRKAVTWDSVLVRLQFHECSVTLDRIYSITFLALGHYSAKQANTNFVLMPSVKIHLKDWQN